MAEISKAGVPDRNTAGQLGDIYINTITGDRYKLTYISTTTTYDGVTKDYEWELVDDRSDGGGCGADLSNLSLGINNQTLTLKNDNTTLSSVTIPQASDEQISNAIQSKIDDGTLGSLSIEDRSITNSKLAFESVGIRNMEEVEMLNYFDYTAQTDDLLDFTNVGVKKKLSKKVYLPIGEYTLTTNGLMNNGQNVHFVYYDKDGKETRSTTKIIIIDDTIDYIRVILKVDFTFEEIAHIMITKNGVDTSEFIPYSGYINTLKIKGEQIDDNGVVEDKLSEDVREKLNNPPVTISNNLIEPQHLYEHEFVNYFDPKQQTEENMLPVTIIGLKCYLSSKIFLPIGEYEIIVYGGNLPGQNNVCYVYLKDSTEPLIIRKTSESGGSVTIDDTVDYIRVILNKPLDDNVNKYMIVKSDMNVTKYLPYIAHVNWIALDGSMIVDRTINKEKFDNQALEYLYPTYGKICGWLGDSITAGGYATYGGKYLQLSESVNYGISGSMIAKHTDENASGNQHTISVRYAEMRNDLDILIIAGGTNDFSNSIPIGTEEDENNLTLLGALRILCDGLLEKYPDKTIIFLSPINRNINGNNKNEAGVTFDEFCDILEKYVRKRGFYCICGREVCGFDAYIPSQKTLFTADGLHLTSAGYDRVMSRMAKQIINYMPVQKYE